MNHAYQHCASPCLHLTTRGFSPWHMRAGADLSPQMTWPWAAHAMCIATIVVDCFVRVKHAPMVQHHPEAATRRIESKKLPGIRLCLNARIMPSVKATSRAIPLKHACCWMNKVLLGFPVWAHFLGFPVWAHFQKSGGFSKKNEGLQNFCKSLTCGRLPCKATCGLCFVLLAHRWCIQRPDVQALASRGAMHGTCSICETLLRPSAAFHRSIRCCSLATHAAISSVMAQATQDPCDRWLKHMQQDRVPAEPSSCSSQVFSMLLQWSATTWWPVTTQQHAANAATAADLKLQICSCS